jgi:hypothetical protein
VTRGLIVGTGPSLRDQLDLIPQFDGLVFICNNSFQDIAGDVWLACDPKWHAVYSPVVGDFDKWHWDKAICEKYGYKYVGGVWMVDGKAYPRSEYVTPPGDAGGLWLEDKTKISLNHCSAAQLLNLALNQYECDEGAILIGHDFHYPAGAPRHYFKGLSDVSGEYPAQLRKWSEFDKRGKGHDLLQVYRAIADQPGRPPIYNATPGSSLKCFPMADFEDYLN